MAKILVHISEGRDCPDRVSEAFTVANAAVNSGHETIALLSVNGANFARLGYADTVFLPPFDRLKDMMLLFLKNGGKIWVFEKCMRQRGIKLEEMVPGIEPASATQVVEFLADGASTLSF